MVITAIQQRGIFKTWLGWQLRPPGLMLQDFHKFMCNICQFKRAAFRIALTGMQDIPGWFRFACCCWRRVASRFFIVGLVASESVPPVCCYGNFKWCLLIQTISCKQLVYKGTWFDFPVCYHLRNWWKWAIWAMNLMWGASHPLSPLCFPHWPSCWTPLILLIMHLVCSAEAPWPAL